MRLDTNMVTKDGKKMMYLIAIVVDENCEDYDAIWTELLRRMNAVSIPIVRVDWPLYDGDKNVKRRSEYLFYAQTFETGMGFVSSIMKNHKIRSNLKTCNFFNGDAYKNNPKEYKPENILKRAKELIEKYSPDEIW